MRLRVFYIVCNVALLASALLVLNGHVNEWRALIAVLLAAMAGILSTHPRKRP